MAEESKSGPYKSSDANLSYWQTEVSVDKQLPAAEFPSAALTLVQEAKLTAGSRVCLAARLWVGSCFCLTGCKAKSPKTANPCTIMSATVTELQDIKTSPWTIWCKLVAGGSEDHTFSLYGTVIMIPFERDEQESTAKWLAETITGETDLGLDDWTKVRYSLEHKHILI